MWCTQSITAIMPAASMAQPCFLASAATAALLLRYGAAASLLQGFLFRWADCRQAGRGGHVKDMHEWCACLCMPEG